MQLNFNFFNLLILTGCIQGVILAILILTKDYKSKSNLFLSFLLLAYSFNNLNAVFFDSRLSLQVPQLLIFPFSFILAIGPSLYLHTKFTIYPAAQFKKIDCLHFLPFLIEFSWYTGLSLLFLGKPQSILTFYHQNENYYSLPEQVAGIISVFIYLFLTLKMLTQNTSRLKNTHSSLEGLIHKRLKMLLILLGLGWVIWLILIVIDVAFFNFSLDQYIYYPLYIVMSVTIYAIGYSGYFQKTVIIESSPADRIPKDEKPNPVLEEIARRALSLMEEKKLFLDIDLRLKHVAEALQVPTAKLSSALKSVVRKNFYDFVNEFRVKEVQQRLTDPGYNQFTLTSIALDCGFNSKSAFNEIFKRYTGKTPKAYKADAQKDVRLINPDVSRTL
jgi:AraC-like DNA-binding protein